MKQFKKTKLVAFVLASVLVVGVIGACFLKAPEAQAADYYRAGAGAQSLLVSSNGEAYNRITNSTANTFTNAIIDCTAGKDLSLQYRSQLTTAGTAAQTILLQISNDKQNWQDYRTTSIAGNGTAFVNLVTNFSVLGYPYVRVLWVTNAEATAITTN